MDFGKRLRYIRTKNGITQKSLASMVGVSPLTVSTWENNTKMPSMSALISLSKILSVRTDDLLGLSMETQIECGFDLTRKEVDLIETYRSLDSYGKDAVDCILKSERNRVVNCRKIIPFAAGATERYIPKYTSPSAAGYSAPLDGDDFTMVRVDEDTPQNADYIVTIRGTSMAPFINDGDDVYVKKTNEINIGDVGIFSVNGAMYCKQFYVDNDGTICLLSANELMKGSNVCIKPDSGIDMRVCGLVLLGKKIKLPEYIGDVLVTDR